MRGSAEQRCTVVLIQAVAIVFLAGVSFPQAAEPTDPDSPSEEQAVAKETMPVDVAPVDVAPLDAAPADIAPVDVLPAEVAPAEVAPADMAPADVAPLDAAPAVVAPVDVAPLDAAPAVVSPVDVAPLEAAPLDAAPADMAPLDVAPVDAAPAEVAPADVAPADEPSAEVIGEFSEEFLSASAAETHFMPCQDHLYGGIFGPKCCRTGRIYRSEILGRLWVRGEYLAWVPKGVDLPSLVTGSPLGAPSNTSVLFGNERVFEEMSSGGRLTGGFWWTHERYGGMEASYFELDGNDQGFYTEGGTGTIIARPFLDVQTSQPSQAYVSYPGVLDGAIDVRADMELSGAEWILRQMVTCGPVFRLDLMAGYRYGRLTDRVTTVESMVSLDPSSGWNTDTLIQRLDSFRTDNDFHGGELGLLARWRRSCWSLDVTGKIAFGGTTVTTDIGGSTQTLETINSVDVLSTYSGGLLALPSNIGRYRQGQFAIMSEVEVSLRRELVCNLWVRGGYNLLAWSRVGRAADQIDLGVNPSQLESGTLVGEARPAFTPTTTSFWAQGLNVGLEYQF